MDALRNLVRRCCESLSRTAAYLLVHTLPARAWYGSVFLIARLQVTLLRPLALLGLYPFRRDISPWAMRRKVVLARLLDGWLKHLAAFQQPFFIPVRAQSADQLEKLTNSEAGLLFCTVHCFLVEAAVAPALALVGKDLALLTRDRQLANGCLVCGTDTRIPTIFADQNVLLKTRSILRRRGSVIALIDENMGAPLEANILRLAYRIGAPVIFSVVELQQNGEILVRNHLLPSSFGESEESIQMHIRSLQKERDRVLRLQSAAAWEPSQ